MTPYYVCEVWVLHRTHTVLCRAYGYPDDPDDGGAPAHMSGYAGTFESCDDGIAKAKERAQHYGFPIEVRVEEPTP